MSHGLHVLCCMLQILINGAHSKAGEADIVDAVCKEARACRTGRCRAAHAYPHARIATPPPLPPPLPVPTPPPVLW